MANVYMDAGGEPAVPGARPRLSPLTRACLWWGAVAGSIGGLAAVGSVVLSLAHHAPATGGGG